MTPEEITAMAKEAGVKDFMGWDGVHLVGEAELHRFATQVAEKAAAKEREACAQVCESWDDPRDYAAAIRARGQKGGV